MPNCPEPRGVSSHSQQESADLHRSGTARERAAAAMKKDEEQHGDDERKVMGVLMTMKKTYHLILIIGLKIGLPKLLVISMAILFLVV